jgi:GT2 family glycosyltransferase
MADKSVAIVILNWNGIKLFDIFLPSVIKNSQTPGVEIYVADNGSTDGSVMHLTDNYPQIKLIVLQHNYGFAEGYNRALKYIDADYYVLLNSDVEVTANWLEPCINLLESDEHIAVVQPKILNYAKPHQFEYAGAAGGYIDKFGYPFCRGRILNRTEPDLGQYNKISSIFWASGACMFIKAGIFRGVNGFDGSFWAHMEEIDLCWRLKNQGFKILYQPASVVFHLGGGTLPYSSPQKIYLNFRNNLFMLYKNLHKDQFRYILLSRIVLDQIAALKFLAGFYFSGFSAVSKAHISFLANLLTLYRKRRKLRKYRIVSNHPEIYPKSIMWKFYIQRRRKFSKLKFSSEK